MCSAPKIETPDVPPPPEDFSDEQAALALSVQRQRQKQIFAGLASTFSGAASGSLSNSATTSQQG